MVQFLQYDEVQFSTHQFCLLMRILLTDIPVERQRLPQSKWILAAEPRPLLLDNLAPARYEYLCNHRFHATPRLNGHPSEQELSHNFSASLVGISLSVLIMNAI